MELYNKLKEIQQKLIAPKSQYNKFGQYNYRSCEDILEAVKPLLKAQKAALTISDEVVQIGDRYYVKATATLIDCEADDRITNTAYAREDEKKTGMTESQITGACSSFARKYCLNGLFCIDDTRDDDARSEAEATPAKKKAAPTASQETLEELVARCVADNIDIQALCKLYKVEAKENLTQKHCDNALANWDKVKSKLSKD